MAYLYNDYHTEYFENMMSFVNAVENGEKYDIDESDDTLKMCLYMFYDDPKFYKYSKKN